MTTLVNTNKLTWFQDEGEPLKNGYIYVGEVQQDPRSFPKTVTFTDSDGNAFTAAQPLRTDENGRIQWNGVAITATVDGDYSLLILNSNQTQIDDGYIASVTDYNAGSGSGSFDDYRQYALTLAGVKQLDKTPGQTVGNIGKVTATDNLGSDWLVISNTGSPADDIDLIDFDNGTQGQRIKDFLQPQDNLSNVADADTARDNLNAQERQPVVSGFTRTESYFIDDDGDSQGGNTFDVDVNIAIGVFESVGPTGSGADNIWTALDALPSNTKYVDIYVETETISTNTDSISSTYFRRTGSSATLANTRRSYAVLDVAGSGSTAIASVQTGTIRVPVDGSVRFDCTYDDAATQTNVTLYLVGFGV